MNTPTLILAALVPSLFIVGCGTGASGSNLIDDANSVVAGHADDFCETVDELGTIADEQPYDEEAGGEAIVEQGEVYDRIASDLRRLTPPSDYEAGFDDLVSAYDELAEATEDQGEALRLEQIEEYEEYQGDTDDLQDEIEDAEDALNELASDRGADEEFDVQVEGDDC